MPETALEKKPTNISFEVAAAVPTAGYLTLQNFPPDLPLADARASPPDGHRAGRAGRQRAAYGAPRGIGSPTGSSRRAPARRSSRPTAELTDSPLIRSILTPRPCCAGPRRSTQGSLSEEFLLVLAGRSPINVGIVVERFRSAIEAVSLESPPLCITVSLGAALAQPDEAIESLLRRADEALYEAKAMGRNRGVVARVTPK